MTENKFIQKIKEDERRRIISMIDSFLDSKHDTYKTNEAVEILNILKDELKDPT